MAEVKVISANGNLMVAEAMRQAEPDVVAAYPITPQTTIVEAYAKYVADGRVHTELVTVESEHSSMSACIGSSAAGARTATATSSQGLALMYEELHVAAGMRLPIVMANANRALSAPINIGCDHSDIMGMRDTGWIMLFAEDAQDAYDNTVMAFRIAEHPEVRLPVCTALDGFITTHAVERAELLDDATVAAFVGQYEPVHPLLDFDNPVGAGMYANAAPFYANKLNVRRAIEASAPRIQAIGDEWEQVCGRPFSPVRTFMCDDADFIVVVMGSCAGNVRQVARELRAQGVKAGVASIRCLRPFPADQLAKVLAGAKAVAVMDRSDSFGAAAGPLGLEVRAALYDAGSRVPVRSYVYGLGGFDVELAQIEQVYRELEQAPEQSGIVYLGIK